MVDGDASLATGAVVHANVLARVLGLRLLRVEADIVLAPAGTVATSPRSGGVRALAPVSTGNHRGGEQLSDARRLLADAEELLGGR